ncbi:hypothetical protein Tco_0987323 [Tanacetum coccineum]
MYQTHPHDSPLLGGYTPRSDEGRLKLEELMAMCIKLSKHVLDLEKKKDAQVVEILKLKKRVESSDDDLDEEYASKQGRTSDKTKPMFKDSDFDNLDDLDDLVDEGMTFVQEKDAENQGKIAKSSYLALSEPCPQTLIKMKEEKAKEKGVAIKDIEDSSRPIKLITTLQPLSTIDLKDKVKGILQETEHVEKTKKKVQGDAQIERDAEVRIDANYELAARMTQEEQEKYTIEERVRLLAEFFKRRKKQLAAERAEAIRNKPPTKTHCMISGEFLTFIHGLCIDMDPHEFSHVYLVISSVLVMNRGMLLHSYWRTTPEGEGSATPPEPQPTPSTSQPNVSEPQTEPLPTETPSPIFHEPQTEAHIEQLLPSPTTYQRKRKTQTRRRTKKDTKLPQTSVPQDLEANEAVHKEGGDSVERAITTTASLDATHDSDNIIRTQTTAMPNVDILQGMDIGGSPRRQDTMGVLLLRLGLRECLKSPNEPPLLEGHTFRSGEGKMEHQFELMANVQITPHDSPLLGGYTPGSDEGILKLQELMTMCTKLSKQELDLKKKKDAQAVEILRLNKRVKELERQRKSSTSQPRNRKYKHVESSYDDLNEEDASKQGRSNDKTKQ